MGHSSLEYIAYYIHLVPGHLKHSTLTDWNCSQESQSSIHLRSGDMATPCIGIHNPKTKNGLIVLFSDETPIGFTGLKLMESQNKEMATIYIETPAVRKTMYRMCNTKNESDDQGYSFKAGDVVAIHIDIYSFDCSDISTLFKRFFEIRKELVNKTKMIHMLPFSKAFKIIEEKYFKYNLNKEVGYLKVGVEKENKYADFQTGWVGGGMNSLCFSMDGDDEIYAYAYKTMDVIFSQFNAKSGFI